MSLYVQGFAFPYELLGSPKARNSFIILNGDIICDFRLKK